MYRPRVSQLKNGGTQKCFPLPPAAGHPPKPPSQKIKNAIVPALGWQGATLLLSIAAAPPFLSCSINLTLAAFWGTIFVYESCFLAQWLVSHRTRQQGGVVTPPESFAYLASLVRSLLVAQKEKQNAELAPHRVFLKWLR